MIPDHLIVTLIIMISYYIAYLAMLNLDKRVHAHTQIHKNDFEFLSSATLFSLFFSSASLRHN